MRAGGGVLAREPGQVTQKHDLVVPTGALATVGMEGLTTRSGFSFLMRDYGLTIDNLLSVEIVTADGQVRTASEHENTDLFWAVRGGDGNCGIITAFTCQAYPISTMELSEPLV